MKRSPLFLIFKIIILQGFFFLTSKYAPQGHAELFLLLAILLMLANYLVIKSFMRFHYYLLLMLFFFGSGFLQDTFLIYLGILKLPPPFPPVWFATLWLIFLGYYGDVFYKMLTFPFWLAGILGAMFNNNCVMNNESRYLGINDCATLG